MLLGANVSMPVMAQQDDAKSSDVEVITVSGIRGSLIKSMELKRDYKGVMEAISAEDMGKFPDTNLAESLQRVTGVSIDRQNGEGSRVTVRGFAPDYNLVTLNGRQMPASSLEATTASSSRSFDFSNLASEGVAGVEIYKTGKAHIPTGGMGSTINITTTKPLNAPGLNATFGVKGVYDTSSEDNSTLTPELSGLYSNTFSDNKFGVAISGSYQKRENGNQQANVGTGWRTFPGITDQDWGAGTADWGGIPDGENSGHINRPDENSIYSVPQSLGYKFEEVQRTRVNGQLTLQYRPMDTLTATLDYTYSKNEVATQFNDLSAWFNFGPSTGEWTDGPIASPLVYTEDTSGSPADFSMGAGDYATKNENKSLGLNLEWQVSDNLNLVFDAHSSSAESSPDSPLGSNNVLSAAAFVRASTTGYFGSELPVLQLAYPDGETLDPSDMRITGSSFRNSMMRNEIDQFQIQGEYVLDDGIVQKIDFGISLTDVNNRSAFSNVQRDTWGGVGAAGDFDDSFWPRATVADRFDISGSNDPNLQNEFFMWDFHDVLARAEQLYPVAGQGDCGTGFCPSSVMTTDRRTEEESKAAYVQVTLATELAERPVNIVAGVRYEETDVTSRALVPTYSNIGWVSANEFNLVATGDQDFTELTGSYDNVLPNLDIDIEIVDDVILRFSYSETMARPGYADIQGGLTIDSLVRIDGGTGARGNPALKPFESTNYDVSAEWYYGEDSYLSVGYFRKDAKNFIGTSIVEEQVFNLPHPALGSRYAEAFAAIGSNDANLIRDYIIANYPDSVEGQTIYGVDGDDAYATFDITVPVNQTDGSTYGWEVALQHVFGESGFGAIVNATIVDGDIYYVDSSFDGQFALKGLSDTANLIAFYDKDGIQVRIAYNWRDKFLNATVQGTGAHPVYVEEYGQWDAMVSYDFNENLTVFFEGLNLTDEHTRTHGRAWEQVLNVTQTGPRYHVGMRYKF
ncbi:TonB-dependent receptor [Paraneptunicella aestuarii]|uniref:TonB-dependent receptor n=1 Tax=Paraneptunicella aestuarii TaxID=2831148 RepID=UPI001E3877A2|nr:TonB-dependent receptor [Paraneptunicella aestuarii]UAA40813.1 TonB-dependent receptor [Paraneptunicella aestuarii]